MTELTQYVYAFDKANEPIARAKDGDEFSFRTLDCYSGQVCTEEDIVGESFNFSRTNPATGPLYVEGSHHPFRIIIKRKITILRGIQKEKTTPIYPRRSSL